jgi:hypothetical protein
MGQSGDSTKSDASSHSLLYSKPVYLLSGRRHLTARAVTTEVSLETLAQLEYTDFHL